MWKALLCEELKLFRYTNPHLQFEVAYNRTTTRFTGPEISRVICSFLWDIFLLLDVLTRYNNVANGILWIIGLIYWSIIPPSRNEMQYLILYFYLFLKPLHCSNPNLPPFVIYRHAHGCLISLVIETKLHSKCIQ